MMILAQSLMIATRIDPVVMEPLPNSSDFYQRTRIRWPRLFKAGADDRTVRAECLPE